MKANRLARRGVVLGSVWVLGMLAAGGCGLQSGVNAGSDRSVYEGESVVLTAASTASVSLTNFVWEQLSGPAVQLQSANAIATLFVAPDVDVDTQLTFRVTAFSSLGSVDIPVFGEAFDISSEITLPVSDEVNITILTNPVPQVEAGADQTVVPGEQVALNGQAQVTIDHVGLDVVWRQISGPQVTLRNALTDTATFIAPMVEADATLVFEFTAEADRDNMATDFVSVMVVPITATPEADAGTDQVVSGGDEVTLDATGSRDPEGHELSIQWEQIAGTTVELSPSGTVSRPVFEAPAVAAAELLSFEVTVTSAVGVADNDTVHIIVLESEDTPEALITGSTTVFEGQTVTLSAVTSTNPGSGALTYLWEELDADFSITGFDADAEIVSFVAPTVSADTGLTLQLTVTTAEGISDVATVTLTVQPYPAPIADAGPDQVVNEGTTVALNGSGSVDPLGGTLTFSWVPDLTSITLSSTTVERPLFTPPNVTTFTTLNFSLTVTNEQGDTATDTVTVTVQNVP